MPSRFPRISRPWRALAAALTLTTAACEAGSERSEPADPPPTAHDAFWSGLSALCGSAYGGKAVESIPPDAAAGEVDSLCREVLQAIVDKVGAERFSTPLRLDDAAWVGFRLAEVLPLEARVKQELLELTDAGKRLERLHALLVKQGITAG